MLYREPPNFSAILQALALLEQEISNLLSAPRSLRMCSTVNVGLRDNAQR